MILTVLFLFSACLILIGLKAKAVEDVDSFLISNRNRSGLAIAVSIVVGYAGGAYLGFFSSATYTLGWAPLLWIPTFTAIGYVLLSRFAPIIYERAKAGQMYMLPDYIAHCYSKRTALAATLCTFCLFIGWLAVQFVVGGHIVAALLDIRFSYALAGMGLVVTPYILLGGFRAVINTDLLQMGIMALLVAGLLFYGLTQPQGFDLPDLSTIGSFGTQGTISLIILITISNFSTPDVWQRLFAAQSAKAIKNSLYLSGAFYIILTACLCVIFALAIPAAQESNITEDAFLLFALQNLFSGGWQVVVILMVIACLLSTIDTAAFGSAMTLSNDLALKAGWISKDRLVQTTRIAILVSIALSIGLALMVNDIVTLAFSIMGMMSAAFPALAASFLRPAPSEKAGFYSLCTGIATSLLNMGMGWSGTWFDLLPAGVALITFVVISALQTTKHQ